MAHDENDIVWFETAEGVKFSNDPRVMASEMRRKVLESVPHTGFQGPHPEEQQLASVPDQSILENRATGRDLQHGDREHAESLGLTDEEGPEGVDVNEKVLESRERREEEAAEAAEEQEEQIKRSLEAEEEEEPKDDFTDMSADDLKAEAKKRDIDLKGSGIRTKKQLRAALREHDAQNE